MTVIALVSFLILILYMLVFYRYYKIWDSLDLYTVPEDPSVLPFLSVVIPVRNEEIHLQALFESLQKQNYPQDKVEYIFVDDHSTDHTGEHLEKGASILPEARIITLHEGQRGKKQALRAGVSEAKGRLVVISDADCIHRDGWLRIMAGFYSSGKMKLISGPVRISPAKGFFQRFQALEFTSLMGTGAASFLGGSPLMCNGANLAFEKDLFLEAFGELHPEVSTGDDMFLMLYAKKHYPGKSMFVKHPDALVDTLPVKNITAFLNQRVRWASKTGLYRDLRLVLTAFLVFGVSIAFILLTALSFLRYRMIFVLVVFVLFKSLIDYKFLKSICRFNSQEKLLKIFIPSQLLYPFYILAAAVGGQLMKGMFRKK